MWRERGTADRVFDGRWGASKGLRVQAGRGCKLKLLQQRARQKRRQRDGRRKICVTESFGACGGEAFYEPKSGRSRSSSAIHFLNFLENVRACHSQSGQLSGAAKLESCNNQLGNLLSNQTINV